ncbi:hypothetical protein VOI32_28700 [Paraburkholderia caribensis]|uniref:Uncharacterized protein n=1 Tax=Paraburkholderia caribensis TaxID=75105 RepID=A0A9Q6WNR2_9BURK|nr:hypothetical protein [Paraburkholderia caribensis]MCO4880513.1 hypothetical protein [Paraburkholderia caribensis]PTB23791.1 hypothetical protein C9I56_37465 [Paraburkholderia caribensis]QLB65505.1 hypothetical protein A9O66_24325 [Paraburkholderia caribensis]
MSDTNEDQPLTIAQFCERYSISRYIFFHERRAGRMPVVTYVSPRRPVILAASLREWERHRLEEAKRGKAA